MHPLRCRLEGWVEALLGFFYPAVCQICGQEPATAPQGYVGPDCRRNVRPIHPPFCDRCGLPHPGEITVAFECGNCREIDLHFSRARSAVAAKGMVLEIIHRYKYNRALWFEPFLAGLLVEAAAPILRGEKWDLIVPVPLHRSKQAHREFNQAERLARRLSAATAIPMSTRVVRRARPTRTQTQLTRKQRAANVQNAFVLRNEALAQGKRIVLVDDVLTTGATTSACARVLRRGGAEEICAWTVARGLIH